MQRSNKFWERICSDCDAFRGNSRSYPTRSKSINLALCTLQWYNKDIGLVIVAAVGLKDPWKATTLVVGAVTSYGVLLYCRYIKTLHWHLWCYRQELLSMHMSAPCEITLQSSERTKRPSGPERERGPSRMRYLQLRYTDERDIEG